MTTPTNALALVAQGDTALQKLPASKADQIRAVFIPMAELAEGFDDQYNEVMAEAAEEVTPEVSARARRLRLDIAKVRVQAEHARKEAKAQYLLASQAIDGTARILKWAISEKEEALEAIEKHAERMEAERLERLQAERAEILSEYVQDAHERRLADMDEDVWAAYLATKRQEHEDRLEAERLAEEARKERERVERLTRERQAALAPFYSFVDEAAYKAAGDLSDGDFGKVLAAAMEAKDDHDAEQERVRAENERLAKEKAAAEAKAKREREKAEAAAKAAEEKARKEREAAEAARREELARIEAEREKERKAAEEAARKERARLEAEAKDERERVEAEARAREAKAAEERERERKRAEAERARLAAMVEGAPAVVAAARALVDELVGHAIARNPEVAPLIAALREALDAAEPVDADEAQLALVEG